jgi:hypothetical protein
MNGVQGVTPCPPEGPLLAARLPMLFQVQHR